MDRAKLLQEISYKEKDDVFVVNTPTAISANKTVKKILENYTDSKTAFFISGGNTPKKLYEEIALEKTLKVGAALMVDERFGEKMHKKSNELMLKDSGLLAYFEEQNIRFYPILQKDEGLESTALQYDETLRFLFKYFPKSVGILGLGGDGHTAGIPAIPEISKRILEDQSLLVTNYADESGKYGARITMTYLALSQLDLILILVLGQDKREMLSQVFRGDSIEEMPGRFFKTPEMSKKTILITDQIVS